jgi:RNA polymerase sigma-70 factor, ECF subfamily
LDREGKIQAHLRQGQYEQAATLALEAYGPEILGFLVAVLRDTADAHDVFGTFCEDFWVGLPKFRGDARLKTWAYTLAHHASARFIRDPHRRRAAGISAYPALSAIEARIRTETPSFMGRAAKDLVTRLREQLSPEEQALLTLRIDREMAWDDIAQVLDTAPATLRKRFERVKERLKTLAAEERARAKGNAAS